MEADVKVNEMTGVPVHKQTEWNTYYYNQLVIPALRRIRKALPFRDPVTDVELIQFVCEPRTTAEFRPILDTLLFTVKADVDIVKNHVIVHGINSHSC